MVADDTWLCQTNAWMELYTKVEKKIMQESKGLRKQLIAPEKTLMFYVLCAYTCMASTPLLALLIGVVGVGSNIYYL